MHLLGGAERGGFPKKNMVELNPECRGGLVARTLTTLAKAEVPTG